MPDHNVILGSTYFAFHMLKQKYIPLRFFAIWLNGTFTLYYVRLVLVYIWETGISRDFFYSIPYVCILSITKYFFFFLQSTTRCQKVLLFQLSFSTNSKFQFCNTAVVPFKGQRAVNGENRLFSYLESHTYIHT